MAVHLLRHVKAGSRAGWDQPDELRPLSKAGWRQAEGLVQVLGGVPVKRILSSRYVRCVQTVEPLAQHLGLAIEEHPALAEEADGDEAWALLADLAATDAVACTHGNLVDVVLGRLHRLGVERLAEAWRCKKGSTWTIEADHEGRFTRARLIPPPA